MVKKKHKTTVLSFIYKFPYFVTCVTKSKLGAAIPWKNTTEYGGKIGKLWLRPLSGDLNMKFEVLAAYTSHNWVGPHLQCGMQTEK